MSDLSPLSGVERKLDFGAVRAAFDPDRTSRCFRLGIGPYRAARRGASGNLFAFAPCG